MKPQWIVFSRSTFNRWPYTLPYKNKYWQGTKFGELALDRQI